ASLLLAQCLRRRLPHESKVGLLLPASVGGALANLALSIAGRVPVNLNFTAGRESMAAAIDRCGIKTILTSRRFLSKAGIQPLEGMVFLEDVMDEFGRGVRWQMFLTARLLPAWALNRLFVEPVDGAAAAPTLFSRGSHAHRTRRMSTQ